MEKQQSTTKGFAILGMTSVICKFLALVYVPLQTMIIGNYGNGIVNTGYKIYIFIFSLTNAGLPIVISKLVSEQDAVGNYKGSQKILRCAFLVLISLGVLFAIVLAVFSKQIAQEVSQPDAALMLLALAPTFIFTSISCALRGFFQGKQNMVPTAVSQIIEQVLNSILTVVFAWMLIKYGVKYAAAGTTIGTSVGALGAALFLVYIFYQTKGQRRRESRLSRYSGPELSNSAIFKVILLYSLPAILNTVATSANDLIDLSLGVSRMMSSGISHLKATQIFGVYSTQYQRLFMLAIALSAALVTAIIPAISSAKALNDFKMLKRKIVDSYKAIFIVTLPCVAGLTFLAKPIITFVFFSNKLNQGDNFMIAGMWTALFFVIMSIQTAILIGLGKPYIAPFTLIIGMVFKTIINYFLVAIPSINMTGAIIGTAVGWLIACILNEYAINRNLPSKIRYMRLIIIPTIVSVIMGVFALLSYNIIKFMFGLVIHSKTTAAALIVNDTGVLFAVAVAAFIYLSLMIKSGGINSYDILRLPMGNRLIKLISKIPFLKKELNV